MKVMKMLWKHCKAWMFTTVIVMLVLIVASLVVTQNTFVYGTIKILLGSERRVLLEGDASKYQYYTVGKDGEYGFKQFTPDGEIKSKSDALKQANRLNEEIASEGFVLLKNEDYKAGSRALPIRTPKSESEAASSNPKISIFGKNSTNLVYGGSGSGGGLGESVTIYQALSDAGFDCNPKLRDFYNSRAAGDGRSPNPAIGDDTFGLKTGETPLANYTQEVKNSYNDYNDAAIVVISRIGGEGFDLPRTMLTGSGGSVLPGSDAGDHYLELDNNEEALIKEVGSKFDRVILVVNCATSMELGFIEDSSFGIDAAVWIGSPGGAGINALGKILNGNVNPSGRTVDTYVRDFTADPTWQNIGNNNVAGNNEYTSGGVGQGYYFVEYEEGIYVGYRYWETRGYMEAEDYSNFEWYDENVVYPFGYGLSYSQFSWEIVNKVPDTSENLTKDGKISVTVRVTNNSDVAGKDVVQLYYNAPYRIGATGQIETPHVTLGAYAKTPLIPGRESKDVTLELNVADMASYDYNDINGNQNKGYELGKGNYKLFIGKNAHDCWSDDGSNLSLRYFVPETYYYYTEGDNKVENRFDDVSSHIEQYMSRENFAKTMATMPTAEDREVEKKFINSFAYDQAAYDEAYGAAYKVDKLPVTGAAGKEGQSHLYDAIEFNEETGELKVDYNSEVFQSLLDMLTVDQMRNLIGTGAFNTAYITSIDKPKTTDPDGPAGFTNFMGDPTVYDTCFYCSECVIGATFNRDLAYDMGVMVGIEGIFGNVKGDGVPYSGWYAPAVNIHRSQFGGRNWEYYSEDPILSGKMGASVVQGAMSKGVYTYVKHFAVNDQETNRDSNGLVVWLNEQALREIYLKPFEIIVKEGGATAIMSSFNRIGQVWAGGSYELLTEVLRGEWGFKGMVITDYNLQYDGYMRVEQMIRAGGDLNLVQGGLPDCDPNNATEVNLLRRATHNILYTVAGSNAMNGMGEGNVWGYAMPTWVMILIIVDCLVAVGFGVWGFFAIRRAIKKTKAEEEGSGGSDDSDGPVIPEGNAAAEGADIG